MTDRQKRLCRRKCQKRQSLHHHAADKVIEEVLTPFLAKNFLLRPRGNNRSNGMNKRPVSNTFKTNQSNPKNSGVASGTAAVDFDPPNSAANNVAVIPQPPRIFPGRSVKLSADNKNAAISKQCK